MNAHAKGAAIPTADMRAARLTALGTIEVGREPPPAIGPRDLLVRVLATGICGSDLATWRGTHPYKRPPVVLGHEMAGEVVAMGSLVSGFGRGQLVTAASFDACGDCAECRRGAEQLCAAKRAICHEGWQGSFAEYVRLTETMSFALPDSIDPERGALVEPLSIALHGLQLAAPLKGCRLAILGSGSIGLSALLCARRMGAARVLCIDLGPVKRDLALACGADIFLDAGQGDGDHGLSARVATGLGGLADVTVVASGHAGAVAEAAAITRPGGDVVVVSYFERETPIDVTTLVRREIALRCSALSNAADFAQVIGWLADGSLDPLPMVTHRFPLEETAAALRLLHERGFEAGKILLKPGIAETKEAMRP